MRQKQMQKTTSETTRMDGVILLQILTLPIFQSQENWPQCQVKKTK